MLKVLILVTLLDRIENFVVLLEGKIELFNLIFIVNKLLVGALKNRKFMLCFVVFLELRRG